MREAGWDLEEMLVTNGNRVWEIQRGVGRFFLMYHILSKIARSFLITTITTFLVVMGKDLVIMRTKRIS